MKKKIIIAAALLTTLTLITVGLYLNRKNLKYREHDGQTPVETKKIAQAGEAVADLEREEKTAAAPQAASRGRHAAGGNYKDTDKSGFFADQLGSADERNHVATLPMGKIFNPQGSTERKLEYSITANYQIDTIKSARAFFNQWIPRYGFLVNETASGHGSGYMTLRVRVRSANLYTALNDLDSIGNLTSENITVTDHTENAVHQQMLGAREDIRNRRRSIANAQTGTGNKNWEATENFLSQSEDRQLATRMEEWRINDRIGWATIQITLTLPVAVTPAPVEVPEFRNAFIGLLNVLLQIVYAMIYLIPLMLVGYVAYRGALRILPALRRLIPGAAYQK